jgi:hypothetical protein
MADTVETLRAEIDMLKSTLSTFMAYATPVIDSHQPMPPDPNAGPLTIVPLGPPPLDFLPQEPPAYVGDVPTPPGVTWPPNGA